MRLVPLVLALVLLGPTPPAAAHPVPFSYLDLHIGADGVEATFVAHVLDLAHDLDIADASRLLDPAVARASEQRIAALLGPRIRVTADGAALAASWSDPEPLPDRQALRMRIRFAPRTTPGRLRIECAAFPYDANHETFLNIYEGGALTLQAIFDRDRGRIDYFTGSRQGTFAVVSTFVPSGIQHIAIGPDHVLFLVGLLLLGGGLWQLVRIVTAFTVGHSITLALAALNVLSPPAILIEPAIAMTIVYVGLDNLMAFREGRDVRARVALAFGLIHGFGFAAVLKEFGLPREALGWSLFSFNAGVEIGQLIIVALVAGLLTSVRQRSEPLARRVAFAGSLAIVAAGSYWFVQRVFFTGGIS